MQRVRTHSVLQLEAAECGAASLAMVLSSFGRQVPLDELRTLCGISRDGAKASNILKAARSFGLTCKGLKAEPEQLENLTAPVIAFVNFNHFLVVEGIKGDTVYINDPASGHRKETREEFLAGFTGVVLTFEAGEDFQAGDSRPSVVQSLAKRMGGFHSPLLYIFLISLALVIPGIIMPFFSQVFVDYILVRALDDWLWPLLLGMLLTAVLRVALSIVQGFTLISLDVEMKQQTSAELFRHLLRLPVSFFEQRFTGEIADRIRLNEGLVELLSEQLIQAMLNFILAIFYLVALFYMHATLAFIVVILACLNIAVLMATTSFVSEKYRKLSIDQGKLMGARISGLKDIETYKASGAEDMLFTRWMGLKTNVINGSQQVAGVSSWVQPIPALISTLILLVTLIGGGYAVMQGQLSLGELVAFQSLAVSFSAPVAVLASFGAELQQLQTYLNRLDDTLEQRVDPAFNESRTMLATRMPAGQVALNAASFGYNPLDPPLIDALSIDIQPGQRVALVGASGSGKSTVGKMIGGMVQLSAGSISIDGQSHHEWPRGLLASQLAYVRQEVMLFKGSIRENINLWDTRIDESDIIQAAKDAGIHDTIMARPGGYDAHVADGANNLSGGEQQRLELARALATNPAIIILDEATSALDPLTEQSVMGAIRRRGLTCIVIAHRLSAIRDCDEILVLHYGQLIERGSHTDLLHQDGAYAQLINA